MIRLTEIFRQAARAGSCATRTGSIAASCRPSPERTTAGDCYGIRVTDPEDTQAKLLDLILHRIPERFGLDLVNDVQVLTPVNRGRSGTQALNELLQAHLNPNPPLVLTRGQSRLALGDKVMQLENDYDREVYNGDVGRITAIDQRAQTLEVTMDGRRLTYAADELDCLAIAYAATVHKAQGSNTPPSCCRCCASMVACCAATCSIPPSPAPGGWWSCSPSQRPWSGRCATPATCAEPPCSATA